MDINILCCAWLFSLTFICSNGVFSQNAECLPQIKRTELAKKLRGIKLINWRGNYKLGDPIRDDSEGLQMSCTRGMILKDECTAKIVYYQKVPTDVIQRQAMVLTRIRDAVPWKGSKALSTQIWAFDDELWLNDERFSYIVMRREKGTVLDALTECGRLPLQISPAGGAVILSSYVEICQSLHRLNCIHLNWNLRSVYITMDDEYVAGNFSLDVAEHFPKDFPDLLNGMVADLIEALKSILVLLVDDTSGFLQTRNWEYYDSLVEDYTTTARKIVNNLKNVAVVDYTPLQSIIARLLIREQYNGLIPWRNRREENLLSARASKMIDQGTKEAIDAFQARQKAKLKKKLNKGRN